MPQRPTRPLLFVLLLALALTGTGSSSAQAQDQLAPFSSDGCSLFPDGTLAERNLWCDCCRTHDRAYWQGGTEAERARADVALRACVLAKTGDATLAENMYLGVRAGGHPAFPTWYRWGYGWPYGRGYQPLTTTERQQLQTRLAEYAREQPTDTCTPTTPTTPDSKKATP